ncbi:Galectin-12 [Sciurus carolinensis]|uniref:Galectin n=1 Tax=Sciurus carolinensis TaxID=30640 RepID=A0AA41MNH8_SCICA|nr:Galectin-12 [Sciurus carolinensis]
MVMLQGVVPLRAHRFQVDFQCGCSLRPQPDIAIHFNPRFHTTKPHVICNTLLSGRWQREARWPGLALQRGAGFLILFLFGNEEVKVSVDGRHFLHYRYRIPLSRVDTLGIFGDILVKAVGFLNISPFQEGSREYPTGHVSLSGQGWALWSGKAGHTSGSVPAPLGGLQLHCSGPAASLLPGFALSLRDEAARAPVTLRASFTDRTLAWVSPWGRKKLISAPFLFHPQRFFEVGLIQADTPLREGEQSGVSNVIWRRGLSWQGRCHRAGKPGQPSREHL